MQIKQTLPLLLLVVVLAPSTLIARTQPKPASDDSNTKPDIPEQLDESPPVSILKHLDANIRNIKPDMTENEVFKTLGLTRHKEHLKSNSFIRMDGAGGNWRVLLDDYNGYSLAFRDFLGHGNAKCMIRTPNRKFWRDVKTAIPAITTKEMQDDLNRQMEKLRRRLPNKAKPRILRNPAERLSD